MNAEAVNVGRELREAVQLEFGCAPVKYAQPVVNQGPQKFFIRAVSPILVAIVIRPPGSTETLMQFIQVRLWNPDSERFDFSVHDSPREQEVGGVYSECV
jgi:hypothetical protein